MAPSLRDAIAFGVELASEHNAELVFVHVVPAVDLVPVMGFNLGGAFPMSPRCRTEHYSRMRLR